MLLTLLVVVLGQRFYVGASQVLPDSAVYFLKDVEVPAKGEKVLVFSPHPDDETIAVGGYIARAIEGGALVKIVLITNGNRHGLEKRRYREFGQATALLGVPQDALVFLNYPDGRLKEQDPNLLEMQFEKIIREYGPSVVLFPNPEDQHPDHAAAGRIVEKTLKDNHPDVVGYAYLVHHRRFPQPKRFRPDRFLLPPVSMVHFDNEWERLRLTDSEEDRKLHAVLKYGSQLRVPVLRSLLFSLVRKNELFAVEEKNNA